MKDNTVGFLKNVDCCRLLPVVAAVAIAICAMMVSGCKAFYENAGSHTVVGSLTAPVEVTEPTSSCNIKALYTMDGADVYTAKDSLVKIKYCNSYTNNYFYVVKTNGKQDLEVEIEPLDTGSVTNGTDVTETTGNATGAVARGPQTVATGTEAKE